jgi:hypothetical protein
LAAPVVGGHGEGGARAGVREQPVADRDAATQGDRQCTEGGEAATPAERCTGVPVSALVAVDRVVM